MTFGREVVATAVRELARSSARDGDVEAHQALLLELPWREDVDAELISRIVDRALSDAPIASTEEMILRADLMLSLVPDDNLDLRREALRGGVEIAAATDNPETAIRLAHRALDAPVAGTAPPAYLARCEHWLGDALFALGRFGEAASSYSAAAEHGLAAGDDQLAATALSNVGWCQFRRRDHLEAIEWAKAAEERATEAGDDHTLGYALKLRGAAELSLRRFTDAERAFRAAALVAQRTEDRQLESDCLGNLGTATLHAGLPHEAIAHHLHALELSRQLGNAESEAADLLNLASCYDHLHESERGLECLAEAVRVTEQRGDASSLTDLRERLRQAYVDSGHYAEALAIEAVLHPQPPPVDVLSPEADDPEDDADADAMMAEVARLRRAHDLDAAGQIAQEFISRRPESFAGYLAQGLVARDREEYDDALVSYERALDLAPLRPDVHNNLIAAASGAGRLPEYCERYERLVRDAPVNPTLRLVLGMAYRLSDKLDLALRELREAVSLGEASGLAQFHLCITLVAKGRSVIKSGKEFDLDRWSEAWGYFEECWALSQEIHGSRFAPEAELLFATANLLVEMATISNDANPPLMERYGDRELDLLCSAGALLMRAGRADPERPEVERRFGELARFVHFIGEDALRKFLEAAARG